MLAHGSRDYNCPNTIGASGFFQYCQSALSSATIVIVVDNIFDRKTLSTSSWTLDSDLAASWQAVYPIQVRTGAVEISPTTPAITGSATNMPTSVSTPTSTAASSPTSTQSSSSSLSTGGIIGVAVSIICSVLGLIFGIGFKIWKYRKQEKKKKNQNLTATS
jgi:hypothetical protein